jgi:repressor LexA
MQRATLEYVRDYARENGYPPTLRETAHYLGLSSVSTVHKHIHALQKKGYISVVPGSPRAIRICEVP